MPNYSFEERGTLYTDSYRIFLKEDGKVVSPFHDIDLYPNPADETILNMIVEVSRFTNAKMEISKELKLNPIKQDVKKGKMRFIANVFPNKGYPWNYGAFPKTWEDPKNVDQHTGYNGDNDPLDVCEISDIIPQPGSVIQVKILGALGMIDEGETDWKVVAINMEDANIKNYSNINDVERMKPGLLKRTVEWFKYYKVPDGKPVNKFAFNEVFKDQSFTLQVVKDTHQSWKDLISKDRDANGISLANTSIQLSSELIDTASALSVLDESPPVTQPGPLPSNINDLYYVPTGSV